MTNDRIALRLSAHDYSHLLTIATALNAQRPASPSPWTPAVNASRCLRVALKVAAEAAENGTLTTPESSQEAA